MDYNYLTPEQERIIIYKATEVPFTGEYDSFFGEGTFICRRCNATLFSSKDKFNSGCGWPSFDGSFPKALKTLWERAVGRKYFNSMVLFH
jgi:peptide-methionine (R)-S-oxide reductase